VLERDCRFVQWLTDRPKEFRGTLYGAGAGFVGGLFIGRCRNSRHGLGDRPARMHCSRRAGSTGRQSNRSRTRQATPQRLRHQSSKQPQPARTDPSQRLRSLPACRDMVVKGVGCFGPAPILQAIVATAKLIGLDASMPDSRMRCP
jgi:hypothetical protein